MIKEHKKQKINFNKEQLELINYSGGYTQVLAIPGSGKTVSLVECVRKKVQDEKINPKDICVMTYTNKSVDNFKKLLAKEGVTGVKIGTTHAVFSQMINEYKDYIGSVSHIEEFYILKDIEKIHHLRKIIEKYKKENPNFNNNRFTTAGMKKAIKEICIIKNTVIDTDSLNKYLQKGKNNKYYFDLCCDYSDRIMQNKIIDWDDILILANELLDNENISDELQYKYIFVDECQDITPIQFEIIKKISNKYKNLVFVGDSQQSVFSFRGSEPEYTVHFADHFENAKIINFKINYRSNDNIINLSNQLFDRQMTGVKGQHDKSLFLHNMFYENITKEEVLKFFSKCSFYDVKLPQWFYFSKFSSIARSNDNEFYLGGRFEVFFKDLFISSLIDKQSKTHKYKDIAILARTNHEMANLEISLILNNIPIKTRDNLFFHNKLIKAYLGYIRFLKDFNDDEALKSIINVPFRYISKDVMKDLEEWSKTYEWSIYQIILAIVECRINHNLKPMTVKNLQSFVFSLNKLRNELKWAGENLTVYNNKFNDVFINDYKEKNTNLTENISNNLNMLKLMINYYGLNYVLDVSKKVDNYKQHKDGITLSTVHSAKGLEWDVVNIYDASDYKFPISFKIPHSIDTIIDLLEGDDDDLIKYNESRKEEEKRLFYVAITRAKKELHLFNYSKLTRFMNNVDLSMFKLFY